MNGKDKEELVHRLVAGTFITEKRKDRNEVDHIDENKINNRVDNLQWVTNKENNSLFNIRDEIRKAIEDNIQKGINNPEDIKKNVKKSITAKLEEFEDSDIFSFEDQFIIEYDKL